MTTTEETTEATEPPQEDTSAPPPAEAPQEAADAAEAESEATEDDGNPNAEAAKYRKRLRATESERDHLQEQLSTMRQELLTKTLEAPIDLGANKGVRLNHPDDLFTFTGRSAEDFYKDDGTLDREALTEALGSLYAERQELFKPQRVIIPNVGDTPSRREGNQFRDAFGPAAD